MSRRARSDYIHIIVLLPTLLILAHVSTIKSGTSSTPKNLVNLYTHSTNENLNLTGLNQFQNEYQYRQGASKPTSSDRHKTSTYSPADLLSDHLSSEPSDDNTADDPEHISNQDTTNIPVCRGRLRLTRQSGYITHGPTYYQTNLQCSWLIDSGYDNATIRIQFHTFNTECNYDYLYIFDGDSVYSPLVAALSGDMKDFSSTIMESRLRNTISNHDNPTNSSTMAHFDPMKSAMNPTMANESNSRQFELQTSSGKAFIYFHSDTAQSMPGFYLTYSVNSCPLDCSNRGECNFKTLICDCNSGYQGDGCQYVSCPNNCTSPDHGVCDKESCVCYKNYHGADCSLKADEQTWVGINNLDPTIPAKAFHQAVVVDRMMWVIGGKTQSLSNTNMGIFKRKQTLTVTSFDIATHKWSDVKIKGTTGIDHLAELSGHSAAVKGHKIFIYGGMAMNNSVVDSLTVLDTKTRTLMSIQNGKKRSPDEELNAPISVVGHTANIIDSYMYIFLGYNPLYGYINFVQKFNLADNTWSLVEKKGSSILGRIGHSSTYDSVSGLVFIYGGHHAHLSDSLYSFDPHTETWTFLHFGPSPRYYHSSVIINRQLIVLGGNSYNTSQHSDQCFESTYLTYDLVCSKIRSDYTDQTNSTTNGLCGRGCWQSISQADSNTLKRHGHSVVVENDSELILYGGFNGILMNDVKFLNISTCGAFQQESTCSKPKMAISCYWNASTTECEDHSARSLSTSIDTPSFETGINCTKAEARGLQHTCESRETCTDCLNTNLGCIWCGFLSQCQYNKCKSSNSKAIVDPDLCYKDEFTKSSFMGMNFLTHSLKDPPVGQDMDNEMECRRINNCYLCHQRQHCSWQNDGCTYISPGVIPSPTSSLSPASQDDFGDIYGNSPIVPRASGSSNSTRFMQKLDPFNRSFLAFTTSLLNSSPYNSCEIPCYMRRSCNECTTTKCIWCSTSEQCVDSTAYFAYHAMGQCMHYVAHMLKCPVASCSDIETCDKCLTNPKCGWLNDISNTGKGRCIESDSGGPSFNNNSLSIGTTNSTVFTEPILPNWYYFSCPKCQCNGHSYCKTNSSICVQSCQDNTEGPHCDRCITGYFGDPINGGVCRPCRCNGHAQSCHRETGKCYCSTKGIIGHNCQRCDDQNHYIGDPSSPNNGTCHYNLTTDYQYTFNMSKPEDHFYSDINFINVPLRKDSDVDFTIACSRFAQVNITSGTSYKNRKIIHERVECGTFRLRFSHDRHFLSETNYSFYVHVYNFQTPFVLQIAFSQHRTLYLPQFFFTFSSCFLFFFALSGLIWKMKHEYDQYARRQRQLLEMEQMASRPFSTILLEIFRHQSGKSPSHLIEPPEPTPISFEPCFGSNVGVLSMFVQLPGKPNLAIGSALVSLNDDSNNVCDGGNSGRRPEKDQTSVQNI